MPKLLIVFFIFFSILPLKAFGISPNECFTLADFESDVRKSSWRTVNDNVMGGQSRGGSVLDNGTLVFSGATNTNGGGFSSVLTRLNPQSLVGYNHVLLRAKSDGREFRLIFPDNRRDRVVHRAKIPFDQDKNWQNVSVSFEELVPTIFGEPVNADRFEPGYTNSIGLIINDGQDGSFKLQVDWIKICK